MRFLRTLTLALVALAPLPALAQTADPGIVVEGQRNARGRNIPMSDWRVAETAHVLVYSRGDVAKLTRIAHNLEKLHFLLSMLLNRVDQEEDTAKLRVTLIGDIADFGNLNLRNTRWQSGPYPHQFQTRLYYDPREEGPVLATTQVDQQIELERGVDIRTLTQFQPDTNANSPTFNTATSFAGNTIMANSIVFPVTADSRIYAGFAQYYLLTYFPAAYPRWYVEGFGEIFATVTADTDGVIEYGRAPEGFRDVSEWFGAYPLRKILDGSYLTPRPGRPKWTPFRAWALTHLLFFSDEWKAPLHAYLAAVARGASPAEAIAALGDVEKLQRQLSTYRGARIPYERLTYPAERTPPPLLRQLTRSEGSYVRGKLVLGARMEIPPAPPPGADAETARRMTAERDEALRARARWLGELREDAARFPEDLEYQLLLAEAECRSGNSNECLAVADRVLTRAPGRPAALMWKGVAQAQLAQAGPAASRPAALRAGRRNIARANQADTEAVMPLLSFYRTYSESGETAPDAAVQGLIKASEIVPSSPTTRLMLGEELARRGDVTGARRALLPVAEGPFDTPERARAREILAGLAAR